MIIDVLSLLSLKNFFCTSICPLTPLTGFRIPFPFRQLKRALFMTVLVNIVMFLLSDEQRFRTFSPFLFPGLPSNFYPHLSCLFPSSRLLDLSFSVLFPSRRFPLLSPSTVRQLITWSSLLSPPSSSSSSLCIVTVPNCDLCSP